MVQRIPKNPKSPKICLNIPKVTYKCIVGSLASIRGGYASVVRDPFWSEFLAPSAHNALQYATGAAIIDFGGFSHF